MKFNEKLIYLRKQMGISQEELGDKLNVARQTVSKWELGETTPEMEKLIKMSEVFNISLDELIKEAKIPKKYVSNDSNREKLAGMLIFIIKAIFISSLIISIIVLFFIILVEDSLKLM